MSFWDNVKKFAQPYADDDYDDYDEDDDFVEDEYEEPAEAPAADLPFDPGITLGDGMVTLQQLKDFKAWLGDQSPKPNHEGMVAQMGVDPRPSNLNMWKEGEQIVYCWTDGKDFVTVTPGVRFADGDIGDQKRVMTPAQAKEIGSDYIVVGRPITAAEDPVAAYERCLNEFVG